MAALRVKIPKLPDTVRENLIYSLWVMHAIIGGLAVAVMLGRYDQPTLTVISQMFSSTLFAISATAGILVGDRIGKNMTEEVKPGTATSITTTEVKTT